MLKKKTGDRNLERLAKRAMMGLAKTGGIASNGSGDYVIAVSTAKENRIPYKSNSKLLDRILAERIILSINDIIR